MPLENATYIDSLQPDWPLGTDPESQGDDHFRMLKQVLQNTFPAVAGAINADDASINGVLDHLRYAPDDTVNGGVSANMEVINDAGDDYLPLLVGSFSNTAAAASANAMAISFRWVMDNVFRVGTAVFNTGVNPADYLGFGTWEQVSGALFGMGLVTDNQDGVTTWDIPQGNISGGLLVSNHHIRATSYAVAVDPVADHTHMGNRKDNNNAGAGGVYFRADATSPDPTGVVYDAPMSAAGGHGHTANVSIGDGSIMFNNPGYAFCVWIRTA